MSSRAAGWLDVKFVMSSRPSDKIHRTFDQFSSMNQSTDEF